ncbi:hypothetical protein [Sphingomicrobium marinum]|uniref:hypothetical protein n=1 Tax=Sphingomicrobium marinum TaxID=1227950 RepID=UPI002240678D|nr:hypothetical protein [Sphingomicrobium marinum]
MTDPSNVQPHEVASVCYRDLAGQEWRYRGKRARVMAMLVREPSLTQWDILPWHTRLGGTIHSLREDGLNISTELEGRYRHARYRLHTEGSLIIQRKNTDS